jgi:hypothetical protein
MHAFNEWFSVHFFFKRRACLQNHLFEAWSAEESPPLNHVDRAVAGDDEVLMSSLSVFDPRLGYVSGWIPSARALLEGRGCRNPRNS